jgi:hypothetical protein
MVALPLCFDMFRHAHHSSSFLSGFHMWKMVLTLNIASTHPANGFRLIVGSKQVRDARRALPKRRIICNPLRYSRRESLMRSLPGVPLISKIGPQFCCSLNQAVAQFAGDSVEIVLRKRPLEARTNFL